MRISRFRGGAKVLAIGGLSILMGPDHAFANQDTVVAQSRSGGDTDAVAAPLAAAQGSGKIAALLLTAEQQIADGRMWSPPGDNASNSFLDVFASLPDASSSDLKFIRDIPSRFTKRAGAAVRAGDYEQARAFLWWAEVFVIDPTPPVGLSVIGPR